MTAETDQTDVTSETADDVTSEAPDATTEKLDDGAKDVIRKEREKARDAARRAKDAEDRLAAIEADKAKEAEEQAAKNGEFQKLAEERQTKLDKIKTETDALKAERDALAERVQSYEDRDRKTIADGVKDLPDDLKTFDPGDDAPLADRMTWFTKAQAIAAKRTTDPIRGNGRSPESANGRDAAADEDARKRQAQVTVSRF